MVCKKIVKQRRVKKKSKCVLKKCGQGTLLANGKRERIGAELIKGLYGR